MIIAQVSVQARILFGTSFGYYVCMYDTKLLMPFAGVVGGFCAKFGGIVVLD